MYFIAIELTMWYCWCLLMLMNVLYKLRAQLKTSLGNIAYETIKQKRCAVENQVMKQLSPKLKSNIEK